MRPLLVTLWLVASASASVVAGSVQYVAAAHARGVYSVDLDMIVDADIERVQAIVTDYDGLHRLSASIVESRRLHASATDQERRHVVYRACFLVYCFKAAMIESVRFPSPGRIESTVEPEGSDFLAGSSEWELSPVEERQTRIRFHSRLEPRFWIPPVIGPWIIKRKMLSAAMETGIKIEQLAR